MKINEFRKILKESNLTIKKDGIGYWVSEIANPSNGLLIAPSLIKNKDEKTLMSFINSKI